MFDNIPQAYDAKKDHAPLYSSFTKNKIFVAPMSSKEAMKDQKEVSKQDASLADSSMHEIRITDDRQRRCSTLSAAERLKQADSVITVTDLARAAKVEIENLPAVSKTLFKRVSSRNELAGRGNASDRDASLGALMTRPSTVQFDADDKMNRQISRNDKKEISGELSKNNLSRTDTQKFKTLSQMGKEGTGTFSSKFL